MRRLVGIGLVAALLGPACSPTYVLRAGWAEWQLLRARRPIAAALHDRSLDSVTRAKLALVLDARAFADSALGLRVGRAYTSVAFLRRDTLALVLSAVRKDRFEPYRWWFPIVGRVPYKGFFRRLDAERAAAALERRGYDTYLRPTVAFSTLGWLPDPLPSPLLRADSVALVATIVHETFHNTLFLPGQVGFNESAAELVGAQGAIAFFCGRAPDSPRCDEARLAWWDQIRFGAFHEALVEELRRLYDRSDLDRSAKLRRREEVFAAARARFRNAVQPCLRVARYEGFLRGPLNNATVLARALYHERLPLLEAWWRRQSGDARAKIAALVALARAHPRDPFGAVAATVPAAEVAGVVTPCPTAGGERRFVGTTVDARSESPE